MKFTRTLQHKLEDIFKTQDYKVRYEKGNFKSGYCILEDKRVVVINKFFPLESKVSTLIEIIQRINIREGELDENQLKLVNTIGQTELQL